MKSDFRRMVVFRVTQIIVVQVQVVRLSEAAAKAAGRAETRINASLPYDTLYHLAESMNHGTLSRTFYSGNPYRFIPTGAILSHHGTSVIQIAARPLQIVRQSRAYSLQTLHRAGNSKDGGSGGRKDGSNTGKKMESYGLRSLLSLTLGSTIPYSLYHSQEEKKKLEVLKDFRHYMPHYLRWKALAESDGILDPKKTLEEQFDDFSQFVELYELLFRPFFDPGDPETEDMFKKLKALDKALICNIHRQDTGIESTVDAERAKAELKSTMWAVVCLIMLILSTEPKDSDPDSQYLIHSMISARAIYFMVSRTIPTTLLLLNMPCVSCTEPSEPGSKEAEPQVPDTSNNPEVLSLAHPDGIFDQYDLSKDLEEELGGFSQSIELYETLFRPLLDLEDPNTYLMQYAQRN
ncbi:hypothetical protein VNI00_004456 [Paramarasmius palmivorus]|uniref:Uncharacterized protein n=1 Tax=Paramarasmius palmivorus TaxID=297713 RepID=A0AAW0DLN0_9AGAR